MIYSFFKSMVYSLRPQTQVGVFGAKLLIGVLLSVSVFGYFTMRNRLSYTINGYPKYNCAVILNDKSLVKSDSTLQYVRSTKNFVFFYNRLSTAHKIIPLSELTEININQNRNGLLKN